MSDQTDRSAADYVKSDWPLPTPEEALFLAEASALLASSLDYDLTLARIAHLAVPALADWCIVYEITDRDEIRRIEIAQANPAMDPVVARIRSAPPGAKLRQSLFAQRLRRGESVLVPELHSSVLEEIAENPDHLRLLQSLVFRSLMAVPLAAHGHVLGALAFLSSTSGRVYGERDRLLAEDVARRAALAVANARLYREAQRASRLKDEFLATLSHELRTPLNAMLGWSRMLRLGMVPPDRVQRALEAIDRSAHAQAQLVGDILEVSRIMAGKLELAKRPTDLAAIIESAVDAILPEAQGKSITVRPVLQPLPRLIDADPERLQQVVWNLLTNAVKFTPEGGRIEVVLRHDSTTAEITVMDTGEGIDPEFLSHVFERFRQADASLTRTHKGLGLGLAIVHHLVGLHGGTVSATSPGRGLGSTFQVRLPIHATLLDRRSLRRPVAGREALDSQALDGITVLVVDDEPDARELFRLVLEQSRATVLVAAGAKDALQALRENPVDVAVIDIVMPGSDGFALMREIARELAERRPVPAIAVSARAGEEDRARALEAGFELYLTKPLDPSELVSSIRRVLQRRQSTQREST